MFSEQYGRRDDDMNKGKSKPKEDEKPLKFDQLEDKMNADMKSMNVKDKEKGKEKEKEKETKAEMKYSSTVQAEVSERVKALTRGKTKSEMVIVEKEKNLMAQHRSSSLEKPYGEAVGLGLFDAANVACTIVDISKDSTLRHHRHGSPDVKHNKPMKKTSNASMSSTSSNNSGPFALLKESERKKKQSLEDEEY